uniref:GFO_IDH_MocA domain-containing protein n=1 Tax=Rhabditophanes sp. KR3021 TaxID=114890 RepID=A0AC35TGA8_9BILA
MSSPFRNQGHHSIPRTYRNAMLRECGCGSGMKSPGCATANILENGIRRSYFSTTPHARIRLNNSDILRSLAISKPWIRDNFVYVHTLFEDNFGGCGIYGKIEGHKISITSSFGGDLNELICDGYAIKKSVGLWKNSGSKEKLAIFSTNRTIPEYFQNGDLVKAGKADHIIQYPEAFVEDKKLYQSLAECAQIPDFEVFEIDESLLGHTDAKALADIGLKMAQRGVGQDCVDQTVISDLLRAMSTQA